MTDHQTLQAEIQSVQEQLSQREREARRLQRELEEVENQGAQGSAVRGELQQADETIDALRQQLDSLQAQVNSPAAHPPEHEPLTGESGMAIGSIAWVAREGGVSTHLRTHPRFEMGEDVTRLTSGIQLTVLDGPEHTEGYIWWRVRTSDGREGWVPDEGLMGQAFV
jgi:multidrug efflux pump subunit AcrA (membrane-fusion protein)